MSLKFHARIPPRKAETAIHGGLSIFRITMVVLIVACAFAVGGCSWFGKGSIYERSRASQPLEVPPDLDTPQVGAGMDIPEAGSASSSTSMSSEASGATSTPSSQPQPIYAGEDSTLELSDSPAGAWKRVGLALERAAVAEVTSSDESAFTYTVSGVTRQKKDEGGFLKRVFTREKTESANVTRVVRIVPSGAGSKVQVEDEGGEPVSDELARRIISALKQRLG